MRQSKTRSSPDQSDSYSRDIQKALARIEALLVWDSTQAWTIDSSIISGFPNRPFHVTFLSRAYSALSVAKHEQIATIQPPSPAIIHKKCDNASRYTLNPRLSSSATLFHSYYPVGRFQKMVNYEKITKQHEARLTEK